MSELRCLEPFNLLTPSKIVFGWGKRAELPQHARTLGQRAWVVCGSRTLQANGLLDELLERLRSCGIECELLATISHEPEVGDVDSAVTRLVDSGVKRGDFVMAVGGGSAIDLAKAVAALATNRHGQSVRDFLEGVGRGLRIEQRPLPLLAVPTTAGTGSEATKNAVISSYDPPFKKSLRSDWMVPPVVLVDPELTVTLPQRVTAFSGMDAVTQLVESFVSRRAQPVTQALAWKGLELAVPSIEQAVTDGKCRPARERMSLAALLSGMALANSGLGLAHGVAAALGVHARVPHGLACATMLPVAMRVNLEERVDAFSQIGGLVTGEPWSPTLSDAKKRRLAEAAVQWVEQLCQRLGVPSRLSELGVRPEQLPALVKSSRGNSMNGNPRQLSDEELHRLLETLL